MVQFGGGQSIRNQQITTSTGGFFDVMLNDESASSDRDDSVVTGSCTLLTGVVRGVLLDTGAVRRDGFGYRRRSRMKCKGPRIGLQWSRKPARLRTT